MNRREFAAAAISLPVLGASRQIVRTPRGKSSTSTPESTPEVTLRARDQYRGDQHDIFFRPWELEGKWVELGLKDIIRFPGTKPDTYTFHEGDLKVEFQSMLWAESLVGILIGTHTDLSEIDGSYTAVVRGYYRGEGLIDDIPNNLPIPILEAVELFTKER